MWTWVSDKDNWTKYVLLFLNLSPLFWLPSLTFIWESSLPGSKMVVESRSVIRNAKNARGLGRDRPAPPFPSRARLIFALLVLIRSHYTIWGPGWRIDRPMPGPFLAPPPKPRKSALGRSCENPALLQWWRKTEHALFPLFSRVT